MKAKDSLGNDSKQKGLERMKNNAKAVQYVITLRKHRNFSQSLNLIYHIFFWSYTKDLRYH